MNQEIIATYAILDNLIEESNLNQKQEKLLDYLQICSFSDIEEISNGEYKERSSRKIFDTICQKIVNINNMMWKEYVHRKYLDTPFFICISCGKNKPLIETFYRKRGNRFYNICRICESTTKKRSENP